MTTDELIETLERRRTKSMAFEREFGLEGRTICPDDLDALFVTLSISEASALISALKENKRLREALAFDTELCAYVNLFGAREDLGNTNGNDEITRRTIDRVLGQLANARAALQPQGEK